MQSLKLCFDEFDIFLTTCSGLIIMFFLVLRGIAGIRKTTLTVFYILRKFLIERASRYSDGCMGKGCQGQGCYSIHAIFMVILNMYDFIN